MTKVFPLLLGVLAACDDGATTQVAGAGDVGALQISAEMGASRADRAHYSITAADLAQPITGELTVVDGAITGHFMVPAGDGRSVALTFFDGDEAVCDGRARDLSIAAGFTAQVAVIPVCGKDRANDRAPGRNTPPRIEAIFASRRTVDLGEKVAVSVSAFDADGDRLTYAWSESVTGFGFGDTAAAATSWKAGPHTVNENRIKVTVSDGRRGTDSRELRMSFASVATAAGTCAQPIRIRVGDRVRGFTLGKGANHRSTGCPDGSDQPNAPEQVFRLELTERQTITLSAQGSGFVPQLYVRRQACASADREVACDSFSQVLELKDAEPGTYFVFVDGPFPFARGEFLLSVIAGRNTEQCQNGIDDDGDGALDCTDSECAGVAGCLACRFDCDPDPNDCFGGFCDAQRGVCITFSNDGQRCDADSDPSTIDVCTNSQCVPSTAVCGNSIFEPGEQCDDGNTVPGDGCDENCQVVPVCGNGIIEFPEECDDRNTTAGDGCDASCRVERCGDRTCDDGNVCTVDVCDDPTASSCSNAPVPDGTFCDLDGLPDTEESCQAGQCVAPPPDRALIVLDPEVLADPVFTLAAMHDRLGGDGSALFESWATTLTAPMTVNGRTAAARPGFTTFFQNLPRDAQGKIDLADAGFLPSAMVNRFDLRTPGTCGENRLVFTKTSGVDNGSDRMTIIFEFGVPDDGSNCQNALARWTRLRALSGAELRQAAAALLLDFARPERLNQMRTNEFINTGIWELREFHLDHGVMVPVPVADTVPAALAQDSEFRTFVLQNLAALNAGGHELPIMPLRFLAASSLADGSRAELGNLVPSLPGLTSNVNIRACGGCHLTETGTSFVHVAERTADRPSQLSRFMQSELAFRLGDLERFLSSSAPRN